MARSTVNGLPVSSSKFERKSVQMTTSVRQARKFKRIYVAGGEGFIDVFQQKDADHYQLLSGIPSALGARTAGYFAKGRKSADRFYLAVPARAGRGAEVRIYTVQD